MSLIPYMCPRVFHTGLLCYGRHGIPGLQPAQQQHLKGHSEGGHQLQPPR